VRRIVRSEALCLRVQDYHESSKLVTFFTLEHGKVSCLAKGARRLRSKFGAALDLFAQSRIIYYSHETRTLLTLSDAELVHSFSSLALRPERFLAAEQMAEFALRVIQPHDPNPQLYRLLLNYLSTLESLQSPGPRPPAPNLFPALVCSFLMKAASFLGFRPELRRCLICRRPIEGPSPAYFDAGRGGIVCPHCAGERRELTGAGHDRNPPGISDRVPSRQEHSDGMPPVFPSLTRLDPASLDTLAFLLYTPASEIARVFSSGPEPATGDNRQGRQDSGPDNLQSAICSLQSPLELVLGFLGHHFDPLVLNSFHWHARLERNA
jgi:DNA repair protein RecO (recombination protein O)